MDISYSAHIDGSINADGVDASKSTAGGGSGGSVLIEAENVAGHGLITAKGGRGLGANGGGGSGGRIALHVAWRREYQGKCENMVYTENKRYHIPDALCSWKSVIRFVDF